MHFFIDFDSGTTISGWLVPDNPRDVPRFALKIPGRQDLILEANVLRADLRDIGLHATGLAGFRIDEEHIPDIADVEDLTLIETQSGVPIYRRFPPGHYLDRKFLLIEAGVLPQIKMLRKIMSYFALSYPVVERLPLETVGMLINNKEATSVFITGHPNWMRHGSIAREREYVSAALLRDPFEDLAERLLFIAHLAKQPNGSLSSTSFQKYVSIQDIIASIDFLSPKSVLTGFRKMAPEDRKLFRSPMTMTFGSAPEEDMQRRNVSVALDNLAQFDAVGVRPLFNEFVTMVDESLGTPVMAGALLETLPGTSELASILAETGLVADLLDEDIALYSFACEAVEAGLKKIDEQARAGEASRRA